MPLHTHTHTHTHMWQDVTVLIEEGGTWAGRRAQGLPEEVNVTLRAFWVHRTQDTGRRTYTNFAGLQITAGHVQKTLTTTTTTTAETEIIFFLYTIVLWEKLKEVEKRKSSKKNAGVDRQIA